MLLVTEASAAKDPVKFQGVEGRSILTRSGCVAWPDTRDGVRIAMELADGQVGEGLFGV